MTDAAPAMAHAGDGRFAPPPREAVEADVARALAEDIGPGDATAALLDDEPDIAYLLCKEDCVVAGRPWFDACHRALDRGVRIDWRCSEGERIPKGTVAACDAKDVVDLPFARLHETHILGNESPSVDVAVNLVRKELA